MMPNVERPRNRQSGRLRCRAPATAGRRESTVDSIRSPIDPDAVVFVEGGVLPVSGTPTLLLVDSEGLVTHAWIGLLDAGREADVIEALFG